MHVLINPGFHFLLSFTSISPLQNVCASSFPKDFASFCVDESRQRSALFAFSFRFSCVGGEMGKQQPIHFLFLGEISSSEMKLLWLV